MATERGGLALILDLPNEILVKIFQMHTTSSTAGYYTTKLGYKHRPRPRHASQWSSLMLVCRHWREIALATPVLWQVVDVRLNTAWLQLAVERSRDGPLELYFHKRKAAIDSIPLIVSQAHRLRKLLLPRLERSDIPALQIVFRTVMPVLDELRVHLKIQYMPAGFQISLESLDSLDTLFPSLRMIRLQNMSIAWTRPALFRMRYLNLCYCKALNQDLTFGQFLDALEGCTELEDLRLHGFLSTTTHQIQADFTRVVNLPRLQRLSVSEPVALCRQLLSTLRLPPTITLRVYGEIAWNAPLNGTQRYFASMLPEDLGKLLVIRTLKHAGVGCSGAETKLRLWSGPSDSYCSREPGSIMLELIGDQTMERYIPHAIEEFVHLFSPAPLEDITISCTPDTECTTAIWSNVFAAFPKVDMLAILPGQTLTSVWRALAGRQLPLLEVDQDGARAFAPVLLPCLCALYIEYLEWDKDTMSYILENVRLRAMRGLPKLAMLSIAFFDTVDVSKQVREEVLRMVPIYEKSMEEFAVTFTWKLTRY